VGHAQIGEDDVPVLGLDLLGARGTAGGNLALVADALQALGDGLGVEALVVDDEDADRLAAGCARTQVGGKLGGHRAVGPSTDHQGLGTWKYFTGAGRADIGAFSGGSPNCR